MTELLTRAETRPCTRCGKGVIALRNTTVGGAAFDPEPSTSEESRYCWQLRTQHARAALPHVEGQAVTMADLLSQPEAKALKGEGIALHAQHACVRPPVVYEGRKTPWQEVEAVRS